MERGGECRCCFQRLWVLTALFGSWRIRRTTPLLLRCSPRARPPGSWIVRLPSLAISWCRDSRFCTAKARKNGSWGMPGNHAHCHSCVRRVTVLLTSPPGVVHRDLKLENVLVASQRRAYSSGPLLYSAARQTIRSRRVDCRGGCWELNVAVMAFRSRSRTSACLEPRHAYQDDKSLWALGD